MEYSSGSMTDPIVYFNGEYIPKSAAHISPDDRGFLFGDGVYEVARSYGGSIFALDAHLARLHRGLTELRIEGVDAASFNLVAEELLRRNDVSDADAAIYMQVTRGVAPRRHAFPAKPVTPTTYATVMPLQLRGEVSQGVKVVTVSDIRWARCDIKSINLLGNCLAAQQAHDSGATDAILIRDGVALEGMAASLFGVFGGEVRTAPKSNYILPSITRDIAIELCNAADITVKETSIFAGELSKADELFLAGTTVELMPIISVDGWPVGEGRPGPIHSRLYQLFRERVENVGA